MTKDVAINFYISADYEILVFCIKLEKNTLQRLIRVVSTVVSYMGRSGF
jgi:hypothetical protein